MTEFQQPAPLLFRDSMYLEDQQMHLDMHYQQNPFYNENHPHAMPPTPPQYLEDQGPSTVYLNLAEAVHHLPQNSMLSYHPHIGQPSFSNGAMSIPEHVQAFQVPHNLISDHLSSPLKQTEETDPQARPRMTAEQTRELENAYMQNTKPSTQQKQEFAKRLSLTKAKVDNWFQNRRAKTKQQNKAGKSVELKPIVPSSLNQPEQFAQSILTQSPFEIATQVPIHHPRPIFGARAQSLEHSDWPTSPESSITDMEPELQGSPVQDTILGVDKLSHGQNMQQSFDYHQSNAVFGELAMKAGWSPQAHLMTTTAFDSNNPLLAQELSFNMHHESVAGIGEMIKPEVTSNHAYETTRSHLSPSSSYLHLQESPRPVSFNNFSPPALPREAFSRRESVVSELAADVHGMGFPSQQIADDEHSFDSPIPSQESNLATRREQRPAALNFMRAVSVTAAQASPLTARDEAIPIQLRRIKSTGNSLNIATGRIQKPGTNSAQRSPLRTLFLQSGLDCSEPHDNSHSTCAENQAHTTSLSIDLHEDGAHYGSTLRFDNGLGDHSPSNWTAPPLSATLRSDESSPPITPLPNQHFISTWQDQSIPQSAPAHVTAFPNHSPPMMAFDHQAGHCLAPQPQYPFNSFVNPVHGPSLNGMFPSMNGAVYEMDHQPQISRPASLGAQITFPAAPSQADPLKIEFSIQTLDGSHHLIPQRGHCYSFQNSSAKDFEEKGSGSPTASPTSRS